MPAKPTPVAETAAHPVLRMENEVVSVATLTTYPGNARRGNTDAIADSLTRNGQYRPLIVDRSTRYVLAGNNTLTAMRELGWEDAAVTWVEVTPEQAKRIVLADNRTSDLAGYDSAALVELLEDLPSLEGTGFTGNDLDALLESLAEPVPDGEPDLDAAPDVPDDPISVVGDVWVLGDHRVVCGDSTDPEVLRSVMGGGVADAVWTDPPYGVAYVGKTKDALTIDNDDLAPEALAGFLSASLGAAIAVCEPGAPWYVAAPARPLHNVFGGVLADLGVWRQSLVWLKDSFAMGRSHFHYRHEPIFYGWEPSAPCLHPPADRKQDTILAFDKPARSSEHPTMKPVALVAHCLRLSVRRRGVVLDPFGGSGSTLIAAQVTGRKARLVELSPGYVDVICTRWQQLTRSLPVNEASGEAADFLSTQQE